MTLEKPYILDNKSGAGEMDAPVTWSKVQKKLTRACKFSNCLIDSTCLGSEVNGQADAMRASSREGSACQ